MQNEAFSLLISTKSLQNTSKDRSCWINLYNILGSKLFGHHHWWTSSSFTPLWFEGADRYIRKKIIDIIMCSVSNCNPNILPVFYQSQNALTRVFLAYSKHKKESNTQDWYSSFLFHYYHDYKHQSQGRL